MWAVYLIGPTDEFLNALFMDEHEAWKWGEVLGGRCDGYRMYFIQNPEDIDRTDTGWEKQP